jgi:hypothetical protein
MQEMGTTSISLWSTRWRIDLGEQSVVDEVDEEDEEGVVALGRVK